MKRKALFAAVAVAASLTCASCADHSLNSWISDKDWVFEDKLLGSWVGHDEDEKLTFTFTRQGSGYRLDWVDEKAKTKEIQKFSFDITMGRVSGKLYLDYTPVLPAACTDPTGVLVTHGLARIDLADNSFTLRLVNSGRLENAAKHNVRHIEVVNKIQFFKIFSPSNLNPLRECASNGVLQT